MVAKLKVDQLETVDGTGIITVNNPLAGDGSNLTGVQSPLVEGTDYLAPDGDGSSLTGVGVDGISSSATATAITIDSDEQVGIKTTPRNFISNYASLSLGGKAFLWDVGDEFWVGENAYHDGSWKYTTTSPASYIKQVNGVIEFSVAPSGTADSSLPWASYMQFKNNGQFMLNSTITSTVTNPLYIVTDKADSSSSNRMIGFENSSQGRGYILAGSGDSSSPSFAAGSDRRLKENITNYTGGYEKIKSIPVKQWDEKYSSKNKGVTGWIADELDDVFPNAVSGIPNATKDVINSVLDKDGRLVLENTTEEEFDENQTKGKYPNCTFHETATVPEYQHSSPLRFYADVVQALQSAITKIETLEAKVTALENA